MPKLVKLYMSLNSSLYPFELIWQSTTDDRTSTLHCFHSIVTQFAIRVGTWYGFAVRDMRRIQYVWGYRASVHEGS